MSVTFYIGQVNEEKGWTEPAYRCDCDQRYSDAWDAADIADLPYPDLGEFKCEDCTDTSLNLGNSNAYDLIRWLDLPVDYSGEIGGPELAARCRRRLWDVDRNHDAAIEGYEHGGDGHARQVYLGRRPGYLRERTANLLRLAEKAGDRPVVWA